MAPPSGSGRPLVFLDVDGVVNDLRAVAGVERPWHYHEIDLGVVTVCIPEFVPPMVQYLDVVAEIRWLTTWGEMANVVLAGVLGVGRLAVVAEPAGPGDPWWKARAARPAASDALAAGRRVYWIQDFEGRPPTWLMPDGVIYVDTAAAGEYVLLPHHLPPALVPEALRGMGGAKG